jgi:hypothetical protein
MDIDLQNILTPEEQQQLDTIQKKIQNNLDLIYKKNVEEFKNKAEEPEQSELDEASHPKHITTSQREILISVRAEISTVDEKGHLQDVQQCLDNYYHIPVPPDSSYELFLQQFIDKFDSELTSCAKKIYPENNVESEQ